MKEIFVFKLFIIVFITSSTAQVKVANYSIGRYGTERYEHLSFWIKDGKRNYIEYLYGAKPKEIKLIFLGQTILNDKRYLKVKFPNKYVLFINADGTKLSVNDEKGKYSKVFTWEYEGPVNGIGTYCDICAENEEEAIQIVKANYLQ